MRLFIVILGCIVTALSITCPATAQLLRATDVDQADSKGARPIDYLLGFGPTGANMMMNDADRAEAVKLLY